MGTAHCMEIGGQKPRSPFSLAPQSPSNFCLLEDKFWGLPVRRGRTPAQNKKQTNKQQQKLSGAMGVHRFDGPVEWIKNDKKKL